MVRSRLFEQPKIYIVFVLFILLVEVLNQLSPDKTIETASRFLLILLLASFMIFTSSKTFNLKLRINTISRNTRQALLIAGFMIVGLLAVSTAIGALLGYIHTVMEANSIAMIGAIPTFIFLDNPFILFLIIVFFIATLETMVVVQLADVILASIKSTYRLNDPKVWVVAILMGIGSIFYHIYAKFIPLTGELNIHALLIVSVLFSSTVILAVHQKEMESAIYYHIGNNFLAMANRLRGIFSAVGI